MKEIEYYEAADKAIVLMNREAQREFGKLKAADFDEINIIQRVTAVYRTLARKARQRYFEIGFEGYLLGLYLCDITGKDAYRMAEDAITREWVDLLLTDVNPVTKYSFVNETERKAQRLAEALSTGETEIAEIDKALRYWARQTGQYAISMTDDGMKQAYRDAGIEEVMWVTAGDERVCEECRPLDGQVFRLDQVPPKHWGCRCILIPAGRAEVEA